MKWTRVIAFFEHVPTCVMCNDTDKLQAPRINNYTYRTVVTYMPEGSTVHFIYVYR